MEIYLNSDGELSLSPDNDIEKKIVKQWYDQIIECFKSLELVKVKERRW